MQTSPSTLACEQGTEYPGCFVGLLPVAEGLSERRSRRILGVKTSLQ